MNGEHTKTPDSDETTILASESSPAADTPPTPICDV